LNDEDANNWPGSQTISSSVSLFHGRSGEAGNREQAYA
jgi:hypothetical protein